MGVDSEGYRKDWSNSTVPGSNVQGVGSVGVTIWKRYMGGDRGDSQVLDDVLTLGGAMDHGDDGETWDRRRVGVSNGRGGDELRGDPPH